MSTRDNERPSVVVLSVEAVEDIVGRAVRDAIGSMSHEATAAGEWMSLAQVAAMLGVKRDTIRKLVTRDGLPHYRPGKAYTFRRSEIVDWLKARGEKQKARSATHAVTIRIANLGGQERKSRG